MAETGQINQGQSVVSGAPFWEKHTEEGGKRREEKSEGAQKHLRESVQREQTHTHTHTRRLGSQSECWRGAADPAATKEHLALPLISPAHRTDFKTDSQKQKSTPPNSHAYLSPTASTAYRSSTAPMQM